MQNPLIDLYRNSFKTAADIARMSMESTLRMQEAQLEFWSKMWQAAADNTSSATRSAEDVARAAAAQVSRATGSVRESGSAARPERKSS